LTAVPVEVMERKEEELLTLVKSWQGHIPVKNVDILILDEIGKNISGAGMDTKVANRSVNGAYNPWPNTPWIERVFVRDLSDISYGNGVGLGMADIVHDRLLEKIDWVPTRINSLTASTPAAIRTPIHFATDRECLERMMPTVGKFNTLDVTICRIRNTMQLSRALLSENLRGEIEANESLKIVEGPFPFEFDADGQLPELLRPEKAAKAQEVAR
jgi:hypothetical protein